MGFDRARIGRVWLGATAVGVVGLAVVAYLPLAASAGPTLAWGNPDTFEGVVRLLARSDFGSSSLMNADFAAEKVMIEGEATSPLDGAHLRLYLAEMPRRLGLVFPALLLLGALVFVRRVGALGVLFLASFAGLMVLFFARANTPLTPLLLGVVERFSMLPDVVLVFLSGFGVAWLLAKLAARPAWRTALAVALLAATSGAAVVTHWVAVDQSGNTFTRDFGANLMSGMPEGALVFAQGDMFHNALHYQQDVLGRRPDLLVVDLQKLSYGWYLDDLRHRGQMTFPDGFAGYTGREGGDAAALLDAQRSPSGVDFARPVLVTRFGESSWSARYRLVDMGLWSQVVPRGREPSLTEQVADLTSAVSGWERASITRSYGARTWERNEQQGYAGAVARLAALTELAADVSAGAPRDEAGPVVDAWLALATGIAGGARAFVDALHAEAYARAATERIASSHVAPYLARALASARRARDLDPAELRALETLVDLQPLAPDRDLDEELALRAAHLDRRPADRLRLATWLELVNRRLKDPALDAGRRVALVGDAVRRQRRFLARVALARRLSDHASFRELEEAWSRDARTWEAGLAQMTQGSSR